MHVEELDSGHGIGGRDSSHCGRGRGTDGGRSDAAPDHTACTAKARRNRHMSGGGERGRRHRVSKGETGHVNSVTLLTLVALCVLPKTNANPWFINSSF